MAKRSQMTVDAIHILRVMTDNGLLSGRTMSIRDLLSATGIPLDRFRAADSYLLQKQYIKGTLGGDDAMRWLTAEGVDFYETAVGEEPQQSSLAEPGLATTANGTPMPDTRKVFVVHGRNSRLRKGFFDFIRALGLQPIEWAEALESTGKAAPYVGEVLDRAFASAQAIVVLLTPDDEVRLSEALWSADEPTEETSTQLQPRPNVLFEAGMAFGRSPDRTVLVQVGRVKQFSDIAGRHVVRLSNAAERRKDLANRLITAGCAASLVGDDWLTAGDFDLPSLESGNTPTTESAEPSVKYVDLNYPEDSGLGPSLRAEGYELAWCAEGKLARRLDIDGWSLATQHTQQGAELILRVKDAPEDLVLIKKRKP